MPSMRCIRQGMQLCGGWLLISVSATSFGLQSATVEADIALGEEGTAAFTQRIDKIYISIGDVFDTEDPKENNALYRLANKIHINTRESVVQDIILFKKGDVYSTKLLEESERLLRNQAFIYDAVIRPINIRADKVDIQIYTRDVWTLAVGGSLSSKGGNNSSSFDLEESNFLGYGKHMKIRAKQGVERNEQSYQYDDPNLFGSRFTLSLLHSNNSDGKRSKIRFEQPFYALDTKKSYGFTWQQNDKIDNEVIFGTGFTARHQDDFWEGFIGVSRQLKKDKILRFSYGYTYDQHRFSSISDAEQDLVPLDLRDSYPWAQVAYIENRFIKSRRIRYLSLTEDINLGHDVNFRLGWTDQNIGSLNDGLIIKVNDKYSTIIHKGALLSHRFTINGRVLDGRWTNGIISSNTEYYF
ncbi:MAG: POTRA domain-containing protein, partial [Thiohalomonadales bacterium]